MHGTNVCVWGGGESSILIRLQSGSYNEVVIREAVGEYICHRTVPWHVRR